MPSSATYAESAPQAPARQPLVGHTVPALAGAAALRPTDASRELELTIGLQPRNQAQLANLVRQQRDPYAGGFHAYLTPEQYSQQFGPTQASVDAVTDFLHSQGLQVADVSANHLLVHASGSAATVERAFQVQLQDFSFDGRDVFAPTGEPSVPASLAGTIGGIIGLDDIAVQQPHRQRAQNTSPVGSGPFGSGYTPSELRTAYDMGALPTGAGQTIALVEFSGYNPADIPVFLSQFGLGSVSITNRFVDGATITPVPFGGVGEVELDIDVLAGIAPAAAQIVYMAPNSRQGSIDLYNAIVTDNQAKIVSSSWGKCEPFTTAAERASMTAILTQGVAQGMIIFAAAGDDGAFDCRGRLGNPLAVDYPASDPTVVSVGGTKLLTGSGGAYQSESVWNDSATSAGGGGLSTFFTMPSYQTGPGVQNSFSNGNREAPDVSANADPKTPYSVYCTDVFECDGGWSGVGGTSAATPLWAAMTAEINQYLASQGKPGVGDAHATLYRLFNTPQTFPAYHDITVGDNLHYPATVGYDMASGVGTPDAWNIARDLAAGAPSGPPGGGPPGGGPPGGGPPGAGLLTTFSPVRLTDTRVQGGSIPSGQSRCFQITGQAGVPADAAAVALNVTAVGQSGPGWLTVYPNGQTVPGTSTLNFDRTEYAIANGTLIRIGTSGQVCVSVGTVNSAPGSAQVILDVTGYLPGAAASALSMLNAPVRAVDTRTSGGAIGTGTARCFAIAGQNGVPADAAAVVLNVTAAGYPTQGWLTAYPAGQGVPGTSTLNFDTSEYAMANSTIMRVGSGGQVCVSVGTVNSAPGSAQVILDVTGYLAGTAGAQLPMLTSPQRVVDTRTAGGTIGTGAARCFTVAGTMGVPSNATAVVLNLTAVGYGTQGWLTAYPAGQSLPGTSTLNFDTSEYAMANGAIIQVGSNGQVCVSVGTVNSAPGGSHVIIDVVGYLASPV